MAEGEKIEPTKPKMGGTEIKGKKPTCPPPDY